MRRKPDPIRRPDRLLFLALVAAVCGPTRSWALGVGPVGAEGSARAVSLVEAVEMAQGNSPRLARLRALEEAAGAQARAARADRSPTADVVAAYTRRSDVPIFAVPSSGPGTPPVVIFPNLPDDYQTRLGFAVPLYTGGRLTGALESAEKDREAAQRNGEAGQADLVLETTAAYWSLVAARAQERVLAEAVASYDAHLRDIRAQAEVGMAARNDVLAVQVERDRADLGRFRAANRTEEAQANLAVILGLAPGTRVEPTDPWEPLPEESRDVEALVEEARARRSDRLALEAAAAAAQARVRIEQSARRPQVSARAGYDYSNPNRKIVPPQDAWDGTWDVGFNVSLVLSDGGRSAAAAAAARAQAEATRCQIDEFDRRVRLEVVHGVLDLSTARAAVEIADGTVQAARENVRVAADRFHEGLVSSSDLLDAETVLLREQLARTSSWIEARLADARLARALGRTSP